MTSENEVTDRSSPLLGFPHEAVTNSDGVKIYTCRPAPGVFISVWRDEPGPDMWVVRRRRVDPSIPPEIAVGMLGDKHDVKTVRGVEGLLSVACVIHELSDKPTPEGEWNGENSCGKPR